MEMFKKKIERNYFLQGIIFKKSYVEKKKSFEIEIFECDFFQKGRFFFDGRFLKRCPWKMDVPKKKNVKKWNVLLKKSEKVFLLRRCVF